MIRFKERLRFLFNNKVILLKHISLLLIFFNIFTFGSSFKNEVSFQNPDSEKYIVGTGKVSNMYKSTGCGYVIVSIRKKEKDTLILIPSIPIIGFEKNNLAVNITYRHLKTHSKKGCGQGIPVQIISIKKK